MTVCLDISRIRLVTLKLSERTEKMFNFTCFNVDDPHDPSVGLINGELAIPGALLRREVFAPVVSQVRIMTNIVLFDSHTTFRSST
jgi:hypothetical protein